jgi:hypothetical protein
VGQPLSTRKQDKVPEGRRIRGAPLLCMTISRIICDSSFVAALNFSTRAWNNFNAALP